MTKIKEYMTEAHAVSQNDPIAAVRNVFIRRNVSRALVYDEELKGIITDGDIARGLIDERRAIDEIKVRELMTRTLTTIGPGKRPEEAAKQMIEGRISGMPVIRNDEVKGIITKTDLVKYFEENYKGKSQVKDLMQSNVETIKENQSVFHAGKQMKEQGISRLVVTRDKEPIAIITEKDLSLASRGKRPTTVKYPRENTKREKHHDRIKIYPMIVSDLMQEDLETIEAKSDAAKACRKMLEKEIGSLVVVEDGELQGIITKTDIARYLAEK